MPSKAFPSSDKRAKKLFDKVHSDLKSFSVKSYHKYKSFITFVDNYLSFSWIVLKSCHCIYAPIRTIIGAHIMVYRYISLSGEPALQ